MYCVIQEVEIKKLPKGEAKRIAVSESSWTIMGEEIRSWRYYYSDECYERTIRKAYRISIHESYRKGGRVCKKQIVICTMGYYDILDTSSWVGDYIFGSRWKKKIEDIGLEEGELVDLIYKKLQPIIDRIEAEFSQTEEYKAREEHRRITREHGKRIEAFAEQYGVDRTEYDRCYDVFGALRNPEYLKKIEREYRARQEYEYQSQEKSRSYYRERANTYGSDKSILNDDTASKSMLKQFYRTLSKAYHPDSNPDKDTSEEMKLLNQLKSEWGI